MILSALSLYLFGAVLLTTYFAAYASSKGRSVLVMVFSILCLSIAVYLFGYLMEINSDDLPRMKFWNQVQYLALPFYPALWVLLAFVHSKVVSRIKISVLLLLFSIPAITFLMRLTNDIHQLYYRSMTLRLAYPFPVLLLGKGPWYFVNAAFLLVCFCFSVYFYFAKCLKLPIERRRTFMLLSAGAILPLSGYLFILLDFKGLGLDYAAFMLPLSLIFIQQALFRYDLLEVKTLAREKVFENSADAMILVDDSRSLTDFNISARLLFPELASVFPGTMLDRAFAERPEFLGLLEGAGSGKESEKVYRAGDGRLFQVTDVGIFNKYGNQAGRLIRLTDCTEARRIHERLLERATTDALTGLFNRGAFAATFQDEFARSRLMETDLSLVMIDIDHFKTVNDTYGHAGGDEALRLLGKELRARFRVSDVPARIGGEEFAVLLPATPAEAAFAVAEKFRTCIAEQEILFEGRLIRLTLSLGVASAPHSFSDHEAMMKAADRALYASKSGGRNRTTAAVPDEAGEAKADAALVAAAV